LKTFNNGSLYVLKIFGKKPFSFQKLKGLSHVYPDFLRRYGSFLFYALPPICFEIFNTEAQSYTEFHRDFFLMALLLTRKAF
jgi:hypothetical protein